MRPNLGHRCWDWSWDWGQGGWDWVRVRRLKKFKSIRKVWYSGKRFRSGNEEWMYSAFISEKIGSGECFDREMKSECIQSHEFQRRLHFREDWLWRMFSIGKWRVNVFKAMSFREDFISEKIGSGERFRSGNEEWMYSSFQRRLALENVFDREMKSECIHHFREDWLWRTFSIGKWRVNVFKANEFSIGKWRVNVFIISEKIGSGERFRLGNEEWMYSNILRDLLNDYEFQDNKFKLIQKVEGRLNSLKTIMSSKSSKTKTN